MPKTDNYMTYDKDAHRYVLTDAYVLDKLNIDLYAYSEDVANRGNVSEQIRRKASDQVYDFVYSNCIQKYRRERMLALNDTCRSMLMRAMGCQIEFLCENGNPALDASAVTMISPEAYLALQSVPGVLFAGAEALEDITPDYTTEDY